MSDLIKAVIAAGAALLVGLVIGYAVGASGKGDLQSALTSAKQRATGAEASLKDERAACEQSAKQARLTKLLLLTKEHLLLALNELYSSNYGLASQHLATARTRITSVEKNIKDKHKQRVRKLFDQMANTQTLMMRLDPMARKYLQDLLRDLQAIPGAR